MVIYYLGDNIWLLTSGQSNRGRGHTQAIGIDLGRGREVLYRAEWDRGLNA